MLVLASGEPASAPNEDDIKMAADVMPSILKPEWAVVMSIIPSWLVAFEHRPAVDLRGLRTSSYLAIYSDP